MRAADEWDLMCLWLAKLEVELYVKSESSTADGVLLLTAAASRGLAGYLKIISFVFHFIVPKAFEIPAGRLGFFQSYLNRSQSTVNSTRNEEEVIEEEKKVAINYEILMNLNFSTGLNFSASVF